MDWYKMYLYINGGDAVPQAVCLYVTHFQQQKMANNDPIEELKHKFSP